MPDSQKTKKSKAKTKRQQELEALASQAVFLDRETAEDVIHRKHPPIGISDQEPELEPGQRLGDTVKPVGTKPEKL
ncbi:MAG: hypothetical protein AB1720_06300 [Pseudomonadota bacterium]